jgi:hypothetical protein
MALVSIYRSLGVKDKPILVCFTADQSDGVIISAGPRDAEFGQTYGRLERHGQVKE